VTVGALVEIWEQTRPKPIQSYSWGAETSLRVKINPVDSEIVATSVSDRGVCFYDLRMSSPIYKTIMRSRTNALSWNPLEAFLLTTANEDCNLYTYDMRNMSSAICVHRDFTSSVTDIDYSPTGREFVAGSYDRSIRIYPFNKGHSRELYHTERMQRVTSVGYSMDAEYVFSGSDDMNVRVWKASAAKQQGVLLKSEKYKQDYNATLIERYKYIREINKIVTKRSIPRTILNNANKKRVAADRQRRKLDNITEHGAPYCHQHNSLRKNNIEQNLNKF
jgi:WD repeat and SOF domain-containing protein 1